MIDTTGKQTTSLIMETSQVDEDMKPYKSNQIAPESLATKEIAKKDAHHSDKEHLFEKILNVKVTEEEGEVIKMFGIERLLKDLDAIIDQKSPSQERAATVE